MYDSTNHPDHDTLATHALEALPNHDAIEVGQHLAGCVQCRRELDDLHIATDLIPYGLVLVDPPADLRERILTRAERSLDLPQAFTNPQPIVPPQRKRGYAHLWRPLALAAMLVLAFMLGRFIPFQQNTRLTNQPGAQVATLAGHGNGSFIVVPSINHAQLTVEGLPVLLPNQVYQLWLLGGSAPISSGTFTVDNTGRGQIDIRGLAWSSTYQGIAITAEPSGGSPAPTSDIIMKGTVSLDTSSHT